MTFPDSLAVLRALTFLVRRRGVRWRTSGPKVNIQRPHIPGRKEIPAETGMDTIFIVSIQVSDTDRQLQPTFEMTWVAGYKGQDPLAAEHPRANESTKQDRLRVFQCYVQGGTGPRDP